MTAAVILASGLSGRMGTHKALLEWRPRVTFLEKLAGECLDAGCAPVVCTVGPTVLPYFKDLGSRPGVVMAVNPNPEKERIFAVRVALSHVLQRPYCLILNVDNPFIDAAILRKIIESADPGAWCSPEYRGQGGHPVLLPAGIVKRIVEQAETGLTLRSLLGGFPKKTVEMENDSVLRNINTPEDYRALRNT